MDPDVDLATQIATALSLTLGKDVFHGPIKDPGTYVSHKAVFVIPTGGSLREIKGVATKFHRSTLQILVRSDEEDPGGGLSFARTVRDAVHYTPPTGYLDVRVQQSEPIQLPADDEKHHLWSINVEVWYTE